MSLIFNPFILQQMHFCIFFGLCVELASSPVSAWVCSICVLRQIWIYCKWLMVFDTQCLDDYYNNIISPIVGISICDLVECVALIPLQVIQAAADGNLMSYCHHVVKRRRRVCVMFCLSLIRLLLVFVSQCLLLDSLVSSNSSIVLVLAWQWLVTSIVRLTFSSLLLFLFLDPILVVIVFETVDRSEYWPTLLHKCCKCREQSRKKRQ